MELASLAKHIFPLASRGPVLALMGAASAQFTVFGATPTYSSMAAVFVATLIGLSTRLLSTL